MILTTRGDQRVLKRRGHYDWWDLLYYYTWAWFASIAMCDLRYYLRELSLNQPKFNYLHKFSMMSISFPKNVFFPKFVTRLALFDYIMNIGWHRMMLMSDLGIATRTVWYIRKGRWLEINSFPSFQHTIIISHNRVILWICKISNIICMRFAAVCFGLHTLQFS